MSETQKQQLEQQLWNIANELRGKMDADQFRDYILGFIFYKYLSEKMYLYANKILKQDKVDYLDIKERSKEGKAIIEAVKENALE
ncbi:MAG TPA: type I restriction-modification system subunit M, partial [bacterium]|nr:type I restriction-modification system subunit M [bacterium]